ncbi:ribosomal RNA processing protein 36 homolog [Patiria miniata]|uniref:rRNA biogenesis protein RRP36 n=1 Tax=Patiria miniata TaxID=46514 RepID=A0A914B5J3_PATMI|nr:ribosomal RNA processing protein 36 homolog [Patiria miniata]
MMMKSKEEPSSSESEEKDVQESEDEDDSLDVMRKELSEVPFEDLQKLQERVGSKVYDKALFGGSRGTPRNTSTEQDARRKKFKRANKNRPQEVSSKVPVSRFRKAVPVKQTVRRDPRFDDLSGKFNEQAFESSYSFLDGVYSREKREVKKELKKAKTEQRKVELQRLLQRMEQQEKARIKKQREKETGREVKKQEKELVKQGKKPFFLKKSEQKKMELANRYMELKQSGKLAKHLARKRKKNSAKDRRHLPDVNSKHR